MIESTKLRLALTITITLAMEFTVGQAREDRIDPDESKAPPVRWVEINTVGGFVAADAHGFWTSNGQHFRFDGTLDRSLSPPPSFETESWLVPLDDGVAAAGLTASEEIVRAPGSRALVVDRYGANGQRLWRKIFGGKSEWGRIASLGRISSDSSTSLLVGGQFSGCVAFGHAGLRCVDRKAAMKVDMCGGDACVEAFVMTLDRAGEVVQLITLPGKSVGMFAGSRAGAPAFAGVLTRVEPRVSSDAGPTKERRELPQTFVAVVDAQGDGTWKWSWSLLGGRGNGPDDIAFGGDGTLWLIARVGPGAAELELFDGKRRRPFALPARSCTALLGFSSSGSLQKSEPVCDLPGAHLPSQVEGKVRLLPTRSGMFAFGVFPPPSGHSPFRAAPPEGEYSDRVLIALDEARWALLVPYPFEPVQVAPTATGVCVAFWIQGAHKVVSEGKTVTLGRPHATTRAIGCFPSNTAGLQ